MQGERERERERERREKERVGGLDVCDRRDDERIQSLIVQSANTVHDPFLAAADALLGTLDRCSILSISLFL